MSKKIKIGSTTYTIKQITPLDFIELDVIPFCMFTTDQTVVGAYDRIMADLNKGKQVTPQQAQDRLAMIAQVIQKGITTAGVKASDLIVDHIDHAVRLYAEILDISFPNIKKLYKLTENHVLMIDKMAERYGKTPIEIEMPHGNFSEIESMMFNTFVFSVAYQHEIELEKKRIKARAGR